LVPGRKMSRRERVLSGMRPSGRLHLGHLHGALHNWKKLQEEYDCYYFVADWHALTSEYGDTAGIRSSGYEMVLDWLAAGIDPEKATIFQQSKVMEHAELHVILSMITPLSWLERCPTYKEQLEEVRGKDLHTFGFLGYPVLQTADIIMYRANWVPVGIDQLPHLELAREIVRRFANFYGAGVFPEPQPKLTEFPKIPGTDGRKMSKSYGNALFLSDSEKETEKKILPMVTDPARVRRSDPGEPDKCPVFALHQVYTSKEERGELAVGCREASIGCIDCKRVLIGHLNRFCAPLRRRREELAADPDRVSSILEKGTEKAREEARLTMAEVRAALKL
jgi:tryptophanyl-tRNA synthetase